jgi:hypothetical protein
MLTASSADSLADVPESGLPIAREIARLHDPTIEVDAVPGERVAPVLVAASPAATR